MKRVYLFCTQNINRPEKTFIYLLRGSGIAAVSYVDQKAAPPLECHRTAALRHFQVHHLSGEEEDKEKNLFFLNRFCVWVLCFRACLRLRYGVDYLITKFTKRS